MRLALATLALLGCAARASELAVPPATYPEWAHRHWVWVSSRDSNQSSVQENLKGYLQRNIPVGAVNVDSHWSTGFNNFVFDKKKFPDAKKMVDEVHALGSRIILWATSMVDTDSPNFAEGAEKGYFIQSPFGGSPPLKWWHGEGGLIDYANPDAVAWWHKQMDAVLDLGIDGWKCDGTDPYILEYLAPRDARGFTSYRAYADAYYSDFFDYTRARLGDDRLIMSRPVDSFDILAPYADLYLSFSPRRVVLSGWVGDQDPTFDGLRDALRNLLHSAWRGFPNFGCDIGGYRSGHRTEEVFSRWFQLGAFLPLMENGGENAHQPWAFDAEGSTAVTDRYRRYAAAHEELVPYLLSTGQAALDNGHSSVVPVQRPPTFDLALQLRSIIRTFAFKLGDRVFFFPVAEEGARRVTLSMPGTDADEWVDFMHPSRSLRGSAAYRYPTPLDDSPAFHLAPAPLPLRVTSPLLGHAPPAGAPDAGPAQPTPDTPVTLLVHRPAMDDARTTVPRNVTVREHRRPGAVFSYALPAAAGPLTLRASAYAARPAVWQLRNTVLGADATVTLARGATQLRLVRLKSPPALYDAWRAGSAAVPAPNSGSPPSVCAEAAADASDAGYMVADDGDVFVFPGCAPEGATVTITDVTITPPTWFGA